jgi:hypothetical protein
MPERLLLVGSDAEWLKAADMLLSRGGMQVTACRDNAAARRALLEADGDQITAAVILGYHVGSLATVVTAREGMGACELADELRGIPSSPPILIVAPQPSERLQCYADSHQGVKLIDEESTDAVREALIAASTPDDKQPWAQVDILVGVESVKVRVALANGEVLSNRSVPSDLRFFLEDWQQEFAPWELYKYDSKPPRPNDGWPDRLHSVGDRLHQYLANDPQRSAIEKCLKRVGDFGNIHFRFVTSHTAFPDVPFETMRDQARNLYIRDRSPLARRILMDPSISTVYIRSDGAGASAPPASTRLTGRVLLIKSDNGLGTLSVGNHRFGGQPTRTFSRLPDLDAEITAIKTARTDKGRAETKTCVLERAKGNITRLDEVVSKGPWDIVHFCGHSVRTDDNEVYLILPGDAPLKLVAMPVSRFAQAACRGQASLVILSSCEGASPSGVFRLAQEGVPAAIGFRWEVISSDAATFCAALHTELAAGRPLGRAYHEAVHLLSPDNPAFISTMLVVQREAWAEPGLAMGA